MLGRPLVGDCAASVVGDDDHLAVSLPRLRATPASQESAAGARTRAGRPPQRARGRHETAGEWAVLGWPRRSQATTTDRGVVGDDRIQWARRGDRCRRCRRSGAWPHQYALRADHHATRAMSPYRRPWQRAPARRPRSRSSRRRRPPSRRGGGIDGSAGAGGEHAMTGGLRHLAVVMLMSAEDTSGYAPGRRQPTESTGDETLPSPRGLQFHPNSWGGALAAREGGDRLGQ